jgi:capsular exopolysaccharide synthesis family protein
MSRFFEALNEASRSQLSPTDDPVPPTQADATAARQPDPAPIPEPVKDAAAFWAASAPPEEASPADPPPLKASTFRPDALFEALAPKQRGFSGGKPVEIMIDRKAPLIPNANADLVVERYRRLRSKIQQQQAAMPIRSLLVASPGQGDGKTVTALNLAWSFGMLPSFKVLVVDGDLRKKGIGRVLGINHCPGMSNLLDGSARLEDVVLKSDDLPFQFVLAGTSKKQPAELLTSSALPDSFREMTKHFDLVLVDSPPVNLMADAQSLAGSCDGVLVVARVLSTKTKALERSLQDLLPFRIVGTILNGGIVHERQGYDYKGYARADG